MATHEAGLSSGDLGAFHLVVANDLSGKQMVQCHRWGQIAKFERHQSDHPEVQWIDAVGKRHLGDGGVDQNHRTVRVHNHADDYHGDNQNGGGHPDIGKGFRQLLHQAGAFDDAAGADREGHQYQQGADMTSGFIGSQPQGAFHAFADLALIGHDMRFMQGGGREQVVTDQNAQHQHVAHNQPGDIGFGHLAVENAPERYRQQECQASRSNMCHVLAQLLVQQHANQHQRQDNRCRELVGTAVQHIAEEHGDSNNDQRIGGQRGQRPDALRHGIAERCNTRWLGAIELREHEEQDNAEQINLEARVKQLVGGDAAVQGGNDHHQQARTQHHPHGAGHGGSRQGQLFARASAGQLGIDHSAGSNNENTGSAGECGRESRQRQYHEAHQFRRHIPRAQHVECQLGQTGLLQHHANPDIQGKVQEQSGQFHHHAEIDTDAVVITLGNKLRACRQTHKAVQRDGQERLAPAATRLQIFRRSDQLVKIDQRQQREAGHPEHMQVEVVHLHALIHAQLFLTAIDRSRH